MNNMKDKILLLLSKCKELKESSLILAAKKISEVLKCIANNIELYNLFESLTLNFNYYEYKLKCLKCCNNIEDNYVVLPCESDKALAFVFCLFVEIDKRVYNFQDFLDSYFWRDKSVSSSYQAFCKIIVEGFEEAIKQMFREFFDDNKRGIEQTNAVSNKSNLVAEILVLIECEIKLLSSSDLDQEEISNGQKMLEGLNIAVKEGNLTNLEGLAFGYNYFIQYNEFENENSMLLFNALNEYWRFL